jgi:hypothetical protein
VAVQRRTRRRRRHDHRRGTRLAGRGHRPDGFDPNPSGHKPAARVMLSRVEVPADERHQMRPCRLARTANRSVVGIMTGFTHLAEVYRDSSPDPGPDLLDLTLRLATTPCGPLYTAETSVPTANSARSCAPSPSDRSRRPRHWAAPAPPGGRCHLGQRAAAAARPRVVRAARQPVRRPELIVDQQVTTGITSCARLRQLDRRHMRMSRTVAPQGDEQDRIRSWSRVEP